MSYHILDKENLREYLHGIERVRDYLGDADLDVEEIGDGNLNFVFVVTSKSDPDRGLIVKQAVPYLRIAGDDFPLSRERMTFEIRALQSAYTLCPENVPEIYHASEAMSVVVMQYLREHRIMRKGMIDAVVYPDFAEHISTYLAENLFKTSSLYLDSPAKRRLIDQFNGNTELCELTENFVFTFAFMDHETNDEGASEHPLALELYSDSDFKRSVLELKYKFMTQTDALLHGDLHTGSIMLNEQETFVIDPEFAFVGPMGFDIGALLGNLAMSHASHAAQGTSNDYRAWIIQTIVDVIEQFQSKFRRLWDEHGDSALHVPGYLSADELAAFKERFMLSILQDSVGFAGCKMGRRMFGIAGVEDIRGIEDTETRNAAMADVLRMAKTFVKHHRDVTSVQDVVATIEGSTA